MSPERDPLVTFLVSLEPTGGPTTDGQFVRHLRLTTEKPKLSVGRSSKTVSKGIVPAVDNAYFDSPVVSRSHAEFAANFEDMTLSITDVGSLHGTSVNDKSLAKGISTVVAQEDTVSFGIHVSRGLDVFYPMSCKVTYTTTSSKPAERARSYCAPDSEDGLSDASDGDCSSVISQTKTKTTTQTYHIIDDDEPAEADDVGDTTVGRVPEPTSDYGEYVNSDDSSEEEDELENEDEAEEIDYDDEVNGDKDEDEDNEDEEEEGEEDDDDEEGDVEGDFLDQALKGYNASTGSHVASLRLAKEATPSRGDSLPVNGLWTPPSVSGEDVAATADTEKSSAAASSEIASEPNAFVEQTTPAMPAKFKFDISSLLNPSPPTSSPPQAAGADEPAPALCVLDTQEVLDATASWGVYEDPLCTLTDTPGDIPQMTSALADAQSGIFLSPIVADIASRVGSNDERSASFVPNDALDHDQPAETANNDDGDAAMTSAATLVLYKKQKASKKRTAEEMLADAASTPLVEKNTNAAAVNVTAVSGEPAAKRQATQAAVAAKKTKGRLWAAAETIGIAALGGAVVLGSLIYTAPSF